MNPDFPPLLDDFQVRRLARDAWRRQLAADVVLEARLAAGAAGPRPQLVKPVRSERSRAVSGPRQPDLFGAAQPTSVMPSAVQEQYLRQKGRPER